jgi:hypothetical protein
MALIVKDRVRETSTTTGTGTITLAGAFSGFRSFADIGNGNTTYYCISGGSQFEVGIGTYTASGTTLSRDTVLSNSLGTTALINFSAGTKDVFVTYPSDKAILGTTSAVASTGTGNVVLSTSPTLAGTVNISSLSASQAVFTDASDNLVSKAVTGTGNVVLSASPTLTGTLSAATITTSADITVNSVKVGRGAGNFTTNLAVGADALTGSNTGQFNLAVGPQTLTANTTGQQNTAFGQGSLFRNTTGAFNTGIGTATLQFVTVGDSNTAVGNSALVVATGNNNIAIGKDAGKYQADGVTSLTTINSSTYIGTNTRGFNNSDDNSIVIGANAVGLGSNTTVIGNSSTTATKLFGTLEATGDATINTVKVGRGTGSGNANNVAVGVGVLGVNTTGDGNSGIGYRALKNNNTGFYNTAFGAQALLNNSTGVANNAFGLNALSANTTGGSNCAVGFGTLGANTTGNNNMAIGSGALATSTTASGNVGVGINALNKNTSGTGNVSIGNSALFANTTGGYNVAIGSEALNSMLTGSFNIAIGEQAGRYHAGGGNTASSYSTYIGYRARSSSDTAVNEVVISGEQATGLGSNTTVIGASATTLTKVFGVIQSTTYTVGTLPSASTVGVGARAFVTDALLPVFGSAVVTGGAVPVPVYSTGSAWNVG